MIEAIVDRLENQVVAQRHTMVFKLRNQAAADVATTIQTFFTQTLAVYSTAGSLTAYQELTRNVVVVPEPISNTILVSATPNYFGQVQRLIDQLDAQPLQVVIQCLIAQVDLNNTEEFGVELSGQSPILFQRSILPGGVAVNSALANPGFSFNQAPQGALPSSTLAGQGIVGFQGLGNFGTGRASPTANVGGLVLSASSDSFNLLIRALKSQGRIDILSRPQIMAMDGQAARINVGQEIPIVTGTTLTATGLSQSTIDRRTIGIILTVTPRISPDGRVIMRVFPEVSSVAGQVDLGGGQISTSLNVQQVETTVAAMDGETVAIGGLISRRDSKTQTGVPILGDLPVVGSLFRYRIKTSTRTELMVILTPHVIRNQADTERILAQETAKLKWNLGNVAQAHTHGVELMVPPPNNLANCAPLATPGGLPVEAHGTLLTTPRVVPDTAVPPTLTPVAPAAPGPMIPIPAVPDQAAPAAPAAGSPFQQTSALTPAETNNPGKESRTWSAPRQR